MSTTNMCLKIPLGVRLRRSRHTQARVQGMGPPQNHRVVGSPGPLGNSLPPRVCHFLVSVRCRRLGDGQTLVDPHCLGTEANRRHKFAAFLHPEFTCALMRRIGHRVLRPGMVWTLVYKSGKHTRRRNTRMGNMKASLSTPQIWGPNFSCISYRKRLVAGETPAAPDARAMQCFVTPQANASWGEGRCPAGKQKD